MLELLRELFPVLVLLYLVDGFTYVNLYHLIFSSTFGGLCKSHNNTSFHLNLFPSGYIIPSHDFPLAVSAQGISFPKANLSANALLYSADDFVRMPYSSMKEIKPFAKQVQINGQTIFKAPAPTFAEELVKDINHFSVTKDSQRMAEIEKWQKKQFNVQFAEQQEKKASHYRSILAPLTLTYFVATFILLPLALFTEAGDYLSLSRLLYLILANYIIIILATLYFSGQLYATTVATTVYENLSLILSPISSIRAGDHLVHNLFVQ